MALAISVMKNDRHETKNFIAQKNINSPVKQMLNLSLGI